MNRRVFTKLLGLGSIGAVLFPISIKPKNIQSKFTWCNNGDLYEGARYRNLTLIIEPSIDIINKYNMTTRNYVNYIDINGIPRVVKTNFVHPLCNMRIAHIDKSKYNEEFVEKCVEYAKVKCLREHVFRIIVSINNVDSKYEEAVFIRTGKTLCGDERKFYNNTKYE